MMSGNNDNDIIPEKIRIMADIPPPPPPVSPLKSPTTPLMPRGENASSINNANSVNLTSPPPDNTLPNASPSPLLSPPLLMEIEEGTPAALALKANADVRVSKLRKVGRSTRLQAGVRLVKSAARTASGQPGHAGDRRGAPAFVAPRGGGSASSNTNATLGSGQPPPTIPEVDDEESGSSDHGTEVVVGSKQHTTADNADGYRSSIEGGGIAGHSIGEDDSASQDKSIDLDDSSIDRKTLQRHGGQHVTHAALPAAIAAACRAGEDMDRKRAPHPSLTDSNNSGSFSNKSPLITPFANLFKSTANLDVNNDITPFANLFKSTANLDVNNDDSENASPIKISSRPSRVHRRSISVPMSKGTILSKPAHRREVFVPTIPAPPPISVFRRAAMETIHTMPSEISVADTHKHANMGQDQEDDDDDDQIIEDLSDDEHEIVLTTTTDDATTEVQIRKNVTVDPIIVEIPLLKFTIEETKEEEATENGEEDTSREDLMAKAKKRMSRRATKKRVDDNDNDNFHFHGPKSVRKWVNKRRSKEESKNTRSYVKGKVIDGTHELYTMSIAVMFGMRTSIGRTNLAMSQTAHNERRWLDNDDLMAVEKYEFPPRGSDITPPHQLNHTFKFKDYSPLAFAYLRRMFGVNEYDFLLSVCGNANYIEFQSNAKSGQFFFYSPDGKYMIKTMTNTESKFLRRILPHYFRHCSENPNTLITKFLGMYRVKLYHLKRNVKFVVMKSVYDTDKFLNQLFDVKGSITGRDASPGDAVKKDNDVRRTLPEGAFALEPGLRDRLRTQVEHDCIWLKSMKIMDYSMLIGVHNISHRTTKTPLKSVAPSVRVQSTDDGDDRSNYSFDASNAILDRFLDVDDDDSYLEGFHPKGSKARVAYDTSSLSDEAVRTVRVVKSPDNVDDELSKESRMGTDALVEKAIEDMYWPFHRFYDIQGLRRMKPIREDLIATEPKKDNKSKQTAQNTDEKRTFFTAFSASETEYEVSMANCKHYDLATFEEPLSYRKDEGFMMDTNAINLPLKMSVPGAPHMAEYCDGKIFYMGIIDILQQFNIRKRLEARYRRLSGKGWEAASCVHPSIYADRFIRFFDEYTEGQQMQSTNDNASLVSDSASNSSTVKKKSL